MDICSSPKLFAAYHVFHRLLVPRHPPCALSSLTRCLPPRERCLTKEHSVAPLVVCSLYLILSVCFNVSFDTPRMSCIFLLMKLFQIQNSQTSLLVSTSSSNVQPASCASTQSVCPLSDSFIEYLRFNLFQYAVFKVRYGSFCFRVEMVRFELMTPCLQGRCSPN